MNENDYNSLFSSLNEAVELLDRNRTPEPEFIAAYDTLKQSRAMLARVLKHVRSPEGTREPQLAAA